MIPLRDTIPSKHFPVVNYMIIGLNVIAFMWQLSLGPHLHEAMLYYGIVPARYSDPDISAHFTAFEQTLPFFTSMFLHGGFLHILGNMWFLFIFGDNIEDTLGHLKYFFFYILSGLSAVLIYLVINWHSRMPTIGASGAIAGVMGAYLVLHPKARILTLVPIIFFLQIFELPAFIFLGYWLILQLVSAGLTSSDMAGIAWWAHVGGFASGIVLLKVFQAIPESALNGRLRQFTKRRTTPRLRSIFSQASPEEVASHGEITITPWESLHGTSKMITISQGFRKRTIRVKIPAGVEEGAYLRLKGLGQKGEDGNRGDLFLRIRIRDLE